MPYKMEVIVKTLVKSRPQNIIKLVVSGLVLIVSSMIVNEVNNYKEEKIATTLKVNNISSYSYTNGSIGGFDNRNIEEVAINYSSIKDIVVTLEDAYYGTYAGDVLGEIENELFAKDEILYTDVASYTAYANALVVGEGDNTKTTSAQEKLKDKDISEEEVEQVVADCELAAGKTYSVTEYEYDLLTRLVQCEAAGEDFEGKVLVANVVMNRVNSKKFPNTIEGVIFERNGSGYQFQPAGGKIYRIKVSDQTRKAVDKALSGSDYSKGALYFVSTRYASTRWFDSHLTHLFTHGNHAFYK